MATAPQATGRDLSLAQTVPTSPFPLPALANGEGRKPLVLRRDLLAVKKARSELRRQAQDDYKEARNSPERGRLRDYIQDEYAVEDALERELQSSFLPQHGTQQLLGTSALFTSPLFNVRSKSAVRDQHVQLTLPTRDESATLQYRGPELRQSDALIFLVLVHMLRDLRLGIRACFDAAEVCRAVYGRYDGDTRRQLREHIYRLQRGLLVFANFSVQLVQQFDYPARGPWTVAFDPRIVELYSRRTNVWLDIGLRLALPEGLSSWLYGYVASQTTLIPMRVSAIKTLCGSHASDRNFAESMRTSLDELASAGVIDKGWSLKSGMIRWLKL